MPFIPLTPGQRPQDPTQIDAPDGGDAPVRFVPIGQPVQTPAAATGAPDPEADPRGGWTIAKDLAASGLQGLVGISKLPAMVMDRAVTGRWVGPGVEALSDFEQSVVDQKSEYLRGKERASAERVTEAGKAAREAVGGGEGFVPTTAQILAEFGTGAWEAVKDPALLSAQVAQQLPMLGASRIGGVATSAATRGAAKVAPKIAATKAGQAALAGAGTAGAVATGAGLQGADIGTDTYQRLMALPDEQWAQLPRFKELAATVGPEEAKALLASDKAFVAALQAGAASVLSTALPGGASMERAIMGKAAGMGAPVKALGKAFAGEAVQEGVEEGYGALAANDAVRQVDPTQSLAEGVGAAAGQGAALGGIMGGGANAVALAPELLREAKKPGEPAAAPAAPPGAADSAMPDREQAQVDAATEALNKPPTDLTALDRVQAIDAELAAAPEGADLTALQAERAALTKGWPTVKPGAATTFSTEAGARLEGQYALIEADDLQPSHDTELRANPAYPQALQPRQRDRAASATQIQSIVGRLDPARLGESATAADGAPIIGADGLVESGNARTIALRRVYNANGLKAQQYRTWLTDNAERFGLTPQDIGDMRRPVLVRVRATPVNRAEFARQANASTVAAMSPREQALSDAARIDSLDDLKPTETGDFAGSRDFIRRFVGALPETERAGAIDADGNLSSAGYARARNAVLAKAYGDSPVLTRLVESMDDTGRNLARALVIAAPRVAQVKALAEAGRRHPADITPALVEAASEFERLARAGQSVDQALQQQAIDGQGRSLEAAKLLRFMADNARRPRRVADLLTAYADALDAAGDPAQGDLLGDNQAPTVGALLDGAIREVTATDAAAQDQAPQAAGDQAAAPAGEPAAATGPAAGTAAAAVEAGGVAANEDTGPDWVQFSPESGTLGIPRAQMPQVRMKDRGAMVQFLRGKGIEHTIEEVDPAALKPTQAEFSRAKTVKSMSAEGDTATALVSADGYIIDGHHRWLAQRVKGQPLRALVFNAPAQQVLDAIHEFPSSFKSGESAADPRRVAVQEFKDALADLGQILTRHQRAALVDEKAPELHKTLVRLFEAGIKILGTDLKRLTAWVRQQLKADPATKKVWNKVTAAEYQRAAVEALANVQNGGQQMGLFGDEAAADDAVQGDLFSSPAPAPAPAPAAKPANTVTLDGVEYDATADNFGFPEAPRTVPDGDPRLVEPVAEDGTIKTAEARFRSSFVMPRERFHERLVDHHFRGKQPAQGRAPVVYVMGGGGASGKGTLLAQLMAAGKLPGAEGAVHVDPDEIKRHIPEYRALLKAGDSRGAAVVHEESSMLGKRVLSRAMREKYDLVLDVTLANPTKGLKQLQALKDAGYTVVLNGITIDPRLAVVRAMKRAVRSGRWVPVGELLKAHKHFTPAFPQYAALVDEATLWEAGEGFSELAAAESKTLRNEDLSRYNEVAERSGQINEEARTFERILGAGPARGTAGRDQGSRSGDRPGRDLRVAARPEGAGAAEGGQGRGRGPAAEDQAGLTEGAPDGAAEDTRPGAAGQGAEVPGGTAVQGRTDAVPQGTGRRGADGDGVVGAGQEDAGAAVPAEGAGDERGGGKRARVRTRRRDSVPAGRDIAPKSGLNYRFTDEDISPPGSWAKRAEWNVEAVELAKKLEAEKRQATPEEQKILARFVGWGASDLAQNLFGDRAERAARQRQRYDELIEKMGDRTTLRKPGRYSYGTTDALFWDASRFLQEADPKFQGYLVEEITREQLTKAAPPKSALRWKALRDRLKAALTAEEWAEASRSTQYAHFTGAPIVRGMWAAMERLGFKGGLVLEPGAGKGNFPGLMPDALAANSAYTGIEFDSITGAILKQLFPDERTLTESFIDSKLPRDFYDVAIGNPPFGDIPILADKEYRDRGFKLHDYFFAKTIDRVRPGGLVLFVTSRYTMDKRGDTARKYLAERADLLGAIRLPQAAFKDNAGTDVVTDVLFLRKKVAGETFEHGQPWLKAVDVTIDGQTVPVNEYFAAHPENVLGRQAMAGTMYSKNEYTVLPDDGDITARFNEAVGRLPENVFAPPAGSAAQAARVREIDFNPTAKKDGNYYVTEAGVLMQREGGQGYAVEGMSKADREIVTDFIPLRDALKQAQYDQLNGGDWETSLQALQGAYKAFTAKHGNLLQSRVQRRRVKVDVLDEDGNPTGERAWDEDDVRVFPLRSLLAEDPDSTLVMALETVDDETGAVKPSESLSKRVLGAKPAAAIATPHDALLAVVAETGQVDIAAIGERLDMTDDEVTQALGAAIYRNPEGGAWETADEYLSGNVKDKLAKAMAAAEQDKRFERNVDALKAAQPAAKGPSEINIGIGMNWIPGEVYEQFLAENVGVRASVQFNDATRQWSVKVADDKFAKARSKSLAATADWGTEHRPAHQILEHALTGRPIRITQTVKDSSGTKTITLTKEMELANDKLNTMRQEFQSWVWRDTARSDKLVRIYNDTFNTTVPRKFDGSFLTLPGSSNLIQVYDHVKRGAWRIVQTGNTYLAHAVGSGKTWASVISAMEQRRLGLVSKPMFVVPNHMLQQFASEWLQLYPAARLMVADEANFTGEKRRRFVSRVALSDLDGVIITHDAFKRLDLDPEFKAKIVEEELAKLRAALEVAESEDGEDKKGRKSPRVKQIEKQIERLEQRLAAKVDAGKKDQNVRIDELGVDMLYVDEAHVARKLDIATSRQVKGISTDGSQLAMNLYMAIRYLDEKRPGRSIVMMSGTPVTNTLGELYTVQKFMNLQGLKERGLDDFDSWAAMFGRENTALEVNAAGKYEPVTRFTKFVNVPELTQMFREFADVLTPDHLANLLGDKRPKVEGGGRSIIVTPKTAKYAEYQKVLEQRYKDSREWKPSQDEPNNPDPLIAIIGDGRLAAIDMRFIYPDLPNDPSSKLNRLIDDVIAEYKETADFEYTDKKTGKPEPNKGAAMMVFSDLGFGQGVAKHRGFSGRAWFEKRLRDAGVPASHVAFMEDYKKSYEKVKLFRAVNSGAVRILVGSSKNMGTGVNAQQRLKSLFHLDVPWFPADLEQREGRAVRQGNKNKTVRLKAYAAKGSYDQQMWQLVAGKQAFIDAALSGDETIRELDDLSAVGQAEMAAGMVADDPRVIQLAGLRADIDRLNRLYQAHEGQRGNFVRDYTWAERELAALRAALPQAEAVAGKIPDLTGDNFRADADGAVHTDRKEWVQALKDRARVASNLMQPSQTIGEIGGLKVRFQSYKTDSSYEWSVHVQRPERGMEIGDPLFSSFDGDDVGIARRAVNATVEVARSPAKIKDRISQVEAQMDALRPRLNTSFPMLDMLAGKRREAAELEREIAGPPPATDAEIEEASLAAAAGMIPPGEYRLSRGAGNGRMPAADVRAVVKRIRRDYAGLPPVQVLPSPSDPATPPDLAAFIRQRGAVADAEGAFFDGKIYLFASGLADAARVEHVLLEHEAAHAGLSAILGAGRSAAMQAIYNGNPAIRRQVKAAVDGGMSIAEAVEEAIADMPSAELARMQGWRSVVGKVRDWLRRRGFDALAARIDGWLAGHLTEQQKADLFVADLLRQARAAALGGQVGEGGAALSRSAREDAPGAPPAPGEPFLVYRVGTRASLENANGGNAVGVAAFLAAGDDVFNPTVAAKGRAVHLFRVTVDAPFQAYSTVNAGRGAGAGVGRLEKWGGVQYSFPSAGFKAELIGSASMSDVRDALRRRGFENFDDAGSKAGGEVIRDAVRAAPRLSAGTANPTPAATDVQSRAEALIQMSASTPKPLDAAFKLAARVTGLERVASVAYGLGGRLIDRLVPERVKAGVVSDYGIPQAVLDRRGEFQGKLRGQLLSATGLIEKLASLTRAESRVAYEWMTGEDTRTADELMQELPADSVKVLREVRDLIDKLSDEAVKLKQLDPETRDRHRFAYLRRSYFKHAADLTNAEKQARGRAIAVLGEQYKGRGMVRTAPMKQIQQIAPEWWGRKRQAGKADTSLKGEKFIRLERRAPAGAGVDNLAGVDSERRPGRLLEVNFWPAGEKLPAKYADWENAGTWEAVDTKGGDVVMWRDFTKAERERMGEIDEARYAIARTLRGMIHDIEVGKYLQWLAQTQAKKPGEELDGPVVKASDRYRDTFKAGEWVQVPDTKIPGTNVARYGDLAGRYLPGPIWNDVRQIGNRPMPFGETYRAVLSAWKTAKTALSPAVHMNNVMSNFVMADWHDVTAGHVAKSLQLILAAHAGRGEGAIGAVGNLAGKVIGANDIEAAREVLQRYEASGGSIGGWVSQEIAGETMDQIRDLLRAEVNAAASAAGRGEVGVYAALQALLHGKLPDAYRALRSSKPVEGAVREGRNLIDLYQAEDDVFRLAAWLRAKENGATDGEAGKVARQSFLDYSINAPWVAAMRASAWPFISYTYRAVPMLLEVAGKRPHKLLKLMAIAGALNALGVMLAGDDDDEEERRRRMLPDEKAGKVWGMVPKLIRMPWNDAHGSPVYLDIRRWIPVGDVLDVGQGNATVPVPPALLPGGPLIVFGEIVFNKSMFTGKEISNRDTDTTTEQALKAADHLWKAAMPNIIGVPGTYATEGVVGSMTGRTDAFGRELSPTQAVSSAFGLKLGSYPDDVLRRNAAARAMAVQGDLDREAAQVKRQYATGRIDEDERDEKLRTIVEKKRKVAEELREKIN